MELPLQTCFGFDTCSNVNGVIRGRSSAELSMDGGGDSTRSCASKVESCKSHKEAERRRRQRINGHLDNLRSLLPNTTKSDKASLLAEVVNQVKELRKKVSEAEQCSVAGGFDSESWLFPGDSDQSTLSYCDNSSNVVKATLCCEDRMGLNLDLTKAIKSVGATAVRAEMTTVGGRTKSVVVMKWCSGGGAERIGALKRALKAVVENRESGCGSGHGLTGKSKRSRYCSSGDGDGGGDEDSLAF